MDISSGVTFFVSNRLCCRCKMSRIYSCSRGHMCETKPVLRHRNKMAVHGVAIGKSNFLFEYRQDVAERLLGVCCSKSGHGPQHFLRIGP
jgi:hypothetical protein